jgi:hypothetical protein
MSVMEKVRSYVGAYAATDIRALLAVDFHARKEKMLPRAASPRKSAPRRPSAAGSSEAA